MKRSSVLAADSRCCVYLLACRGGRTYLGISQDPAHRMSVHRRGNGSFFTRLNAPEALLHQVWVENRRIAAELEARLKRLRRLNKLVWFETMGDTSLSHPANIESAFEALARCSRRSRARD